MTDGVAGDRVRGTLGKDPLVDQLLQLGVESEPAVADWEVHPRQPFVELRAEMNLLVILDTGRHPLDPNPQVAPKPVRIQVLAGEPAGPDDPCRLKCPENARGFINTERYFL